MTRLPEWQWASDAQDGGVGERYGAESGTEWVPG